MELKSRLSPSFRVQSTASPAKPYRANVYMIPYISSGTSIVLSFLFILLEQQCAVRKRFVS